MFLNVASLACCGAVSRLPVDRCLGWLVVFTDFSSAFNTLNPDIVINKLRTLNVSPLLCKFILDFITNREQRVRINDILSTVGPTINQYRCTSRLCTLCYTVYYIHKRITITFQELSCDQLC